MNGEHFSMEQALTQNIWKFLGCTWKIVQNSLEKLPCYPFITSNTHFVEQGYTYTMFTA